MSSLLLLLISAVLINIAVLSSAPAWRPFINASRVFEDAVGIAVATALALPLAAGLSYGLVHQLLRPLNLEYLRTFAFVMLIVGIVSLIEVAFARTNRWQPARPAFMLLMMSNCALFGVAWLGESRAHDAIDAIGLGIGAGLGFVALLLAAAALHERLKHAAIPPVLREAPIALFTAGIMALALMGFSGLIQE